MAVTRLAKAAAGGASGLAIASILRRALRLVFLTLIARELGPHIFGGYVLIFTVVEILGLLAGGGLVDFATRECSREMAAAPATARVIAALRAAYVLGLGLPLGIWVALPAPAGAMRLPAAVLWLALFPRIWVEVAESLCISRGEFALVPVIEGTAGVGLLAAAALLLGQPGALVRAASCDLIANIVGATAALLVAPALRSGSLTLPSIHNLMVTARRAASFNVFPLLVSAYDRLDTLLLAALAGTFAVGLYTMPYRVFAALAILPTALTQSTLPHLARLEPRSPEAHRLSVDTATALFVIALIAILVTLPLARPMTRLLLGSRYYGSALAMIFLCWALIPRNLNAAASLTLVAWSQDRALVISTAVATAFNLLANLIFIPRFSYLAAAAVTGLTEALLLTQSLIFNGRSFGRLPLPRQVGRLALSFLLALTPAAAVGALGHGVGGMQDGLAAIAGVVLFFAAARIFGAQPWRVLRPAFQNPLASASLSDGQDR